MRYSSDVEPPDLRGISESTLTFHYARVNLKTGETTHDKQHFAGRSLFLVNLARWNRQGLTFKDGPLWGLLRGDPVTKKDPTPDEEGNPSRSASKRCTTARSR